jgi:8-oxo-dGTP pyrophosphatase MutT (NUDIX family)
MGKDQISFKMKSISSQDLPRAACVLLKREDGKFLAVSRKDDKNDFGLPGGKKETFESDEQTARRELEEETGLHAGELRFLFAGICRGDKDGVDYWTVTYTGDYDGSVFTSESGVVAWVDKEVLLRGSFGEYNARLFDVYENIK